MARMHNSKAPSRQWRADQRRRAAHYADAMDDLATAMLWLVWTASEGRVTW